MIGAFDNIRSGSAPITPSVICVDLYRSFVFPNRVREERRRNGYAKLLPLASRTDGIAYIRLSKIERGEVFPRADELHRIADALNIAPAALLVDVDDPSFDIAEWAEPFLDGAQPDLPEEEFAVLLGAATRMRRATDPELTISAVARQYGLAPVNLSRIENAHKIFGRWNTAVRDAVFAIFLVADECALRARVESLYLSGILNDYIAGVSNPTHRIERTRARVHALAAELAAKEPAAGRAPPAPAQPAPPPASLAAIRLVEVLGSPLPDGLISDDASGERIEVPRGVGPNAFALRVPRATLGGGMPAQSVVIIDPDRHPAPGGIAALREDTGWRLLSVGVSRDGRMIGYSTHPELEITLDDQDPARLAVVVSAFFP